MFNRNSLANFLRQQEEIENAPRPSIQIEEEEEETPRERFNGLINKINKKKKQKKNKKEVIKELIILFDEMFPRKIVDENEIFVE
jgi:hypothetical protein